MRFAVGVSIWIGLAACATTSPGVRDAEAAARLAAAERALSADDTAAARAELDRVLAARPRGGAATRARMLDRELAARELEPFEPAFAQIAECLERRDEVLARRMLELVLARGPSGAALARAEGFANVLDGRATASALDLALEALPEGDGGRHRIVLVVTNPLDEAVRVRCPGSVLDYFCLGVNERGIEQRIQRRVVVDALDGLAVEPGEPRRLRLGAFDVPIGGMVGARALWRLDAVGGTLARGGRELPANRLAEATCEVVRLDPRLPAAPVEPDELVSYLERGAPSVAALIERAVRIEPRRRDEALDLLAGRLLQRPDVEIEAALPALRWLAASRDAHDGPADWRRRLQARIAEPEAPPPALDLPSALDLPRAAETP